MGTPFQTGDVFIPGSFGVVEHRDRTGALIQELQIPGYEQIQYGWENNPIFDDQGNLYVVRNGQTQPVAVFAQNSDFVEFWPDLPVGETSLSDGAFSNGKIYAGSLVEPSAIYRYNLDGTRETTITVNAGSAVRHVHIRDGIVYYGTDGDVSIFRYDLGASADLSPLVTFDPAQEDPVDQTFAVYETYLLKDGQFLVGVQTGAGANERGKVYVLNGAGAHIDTYIPSPSTVGAMLRVAPDRDPTYCWAASLDGHLFKINRLNRSTVFHLAFASMVGLGTLGVMSAPPPPPDLRTWATVSN
jgi:hypothetical protein